MTDPAADLALFLGHALAMEQESAERYRELADAMAAHNNPAVARLFAQLAEFGDLHAAEVEGHAAGLELPRLAPWDYRWPDAEAPEAHPHEHASYRLTPRQAMGYALENERRGRDFYARIAASAALPALRALAEEFAAEEAEHVRLLEAWIDRTDEAPDADFEDLDPPNAGA